MDSSTNTSLATNETTFDLDEYEEGEDEEEAEDDVNEEEIYTEYDINGEGDMYDDDEMEFFDKGRKGERINRYEIIFRTMEANGLLLWMNKGRTLKGNYIAIAIVNGYIEFSFNLGKQHTFLQMRSKVHVSDGAWHTVVAHRRKRHGYLQVDGETPSRSLAEPGATLLNTNGRLWIGGAPTLPSGLPASYYLGFKGCVEKIKVSRKTLDMFNRLGNDKSMIHFCHDNDV
ncbi:unnamed protein product [Timema podura]|uniref:Laminin G domain-containing protein n=1 Tax=Timema podura TaxID=61482 RepID=A0ABN7NX79_TIMPD|nr:unnamed protein product [Timema podura]